LFCAALTALPPLGNPLRKQDRAIDLRRVGSFGTSRIGFDLQPG